MPAKICISLISLAITCSFAQAQPIENSPNLTKVANQLRYGAIGAAGLDGASTDWVLRSGKAYEANPIAPTSTSGIVGFSLLKAGAVELAYRSDLTLTQKAQVGNTTRAIWAGAAANNILIGLGATGAAPIVGGLAIGYMLWQDGSTQISQAKAADEALKNPSNTPSASALNTPVNAASLAQSPMSVATSWCEDPKLSPVTQALLEAGRTEEAKNYARSRGC